MIFIAIKMMPQPLIIIMGGIRQSEGDQVITHTMQIVAAICLLTCLFFWIGGFYIWLLKNPTWKLFPLNVPHRTSLRGIWILAIVSVLIWIPILPFPQAEQRLKSRVEELMSTGQISEALDYMSAHSKSDFPPHWAPPPKSVSDKRSPIFLTVMETVHARNDAAWVQEAYEEKFTQYLGENYALLMDATLTSNLERVFNLIEVSSHRDEILRVFHFDLSSISEDKSLPMNIRERAKELLSFSEAEEK